MKRWLGLLGMTLLIASASLSARGQIVVSLAVSDANGPITGPVRPGTELFVDVLLSVPPEDEAIPELRSLQLDFRFTGSGLEITDFVWLFDELGFPGAYFPDIDLPSFARADHVAGDTFEIRAQPVSVGRITLTAVGGRRRDVLDLTGIGISDPDNVDQGLRFRAGFADPQDFSVFDGSVEGGIVRIEVGRNGNENGNQNENENQNDNGSDPPGGGGGSGENANDSDPDRNVGPRAQVPTCGLGASGAALFAFASLTLLCLVRRRLQ